MSNISGPKLSIVLPAFNEAERLPPYLVEIRSTMETRYAGRYEVIVVDDGSSDAMPDLLKGIACDWPEMRVLQHASNLGKGAAIRTGIGAARGELLLFADADGATPIDQEEKLCQALSAGADMAVGSRLLEAPDVVCNRGRMRGMIGKMFASIARLVVSVTVRDTQCGFKMFRAEQGKRLFDDSYEMGYLLDLELLALARKYQYQVVEVPIDWNEQPGSRLTIGRQCFKMGIGLWRVRRRVFGKKLINNASESLPERR